MAIGQEQSTLPDAPSTTQIQSGSSKVRPSVSQHEPSKNHIFWIIPNYRSDENSTEIKPLTPGAKMKVALDDSFDPSAFLVAGIFAGLSMAQTQYGSFGRGAQGFGKYYGGSFADQAIGNIMSEGLFPVVLRQDPRYFVKCTGGFWKRTGYAMIGKLSLAATMAAITSTNQSWPETQSPRASLISTIRLRIDQSEIRQVSGDNK
jgi:hypothetical protein